MKYILKTLAIVILLTQLNSVHAASELEKFQQAIRAKYDMKEQAFANDDYRPILEKFYTSDVISVGPDGSVHEGTEGIKPVYEEVVPAFDVYIESYRSHVRGSLGWDWVNFHVHPKDPSMDPFTFKMLFLWEKIKGEWMSQGEMFVEGEFDISTRK